MGTEEIRYQRSRFSTRLSGDRLYTSGHYWLRNVEGDLWHVGLTKFAIRMLGEVVELGFDVEPGTQLLTGQAVGWTEGFKAVTDLYAPFPGRFEGGNPELDKHIKLVQSDTFGRGWLFCMRGIPGEGCIEMHEYASVLDATIDKMLGKRREGNEV